MPLLFRLLGTIPVPTDTPTEFSPAPLHTLRYDPSTLTFGNEHPLS